jgi:hypothetical protein
MKYGDIRFGDIYCSNNETKTMVRNAFHSVTFVFSPAYKGGHIISP